MTTSGREEIVSGRSTAEHAEPATTLYILSDLATPHNNALVEALRDSGQLRVITGYAHRILSSLPWKEGLGGSVDNFYFDSWRTRMRVFTAILADHRARLLLVGYSNALNRVTLLWCAVTRRPFMMWSDHPDESHGLRGLLRSLAYALVKRADPLFVVGEHTRRWFIERGFAPDRVVNLPVSIPLPPNSPPAESVRRRIRDKYGIPDGAVFAVAASRLAHAKGYDILIAAVSQLEGSIRSGLRVVIVGSGPERDSLVDQVRKANLPHVIQFDEWLSPQDYSELLSSADLFLHPARFDAFGGGTLFAMANGVPVIGSEGAGAVLERIEHGVNGLRYPAEEPHKLAEYITRLCANTDERERMRLAARATAMEWPPQRSAAILLDQISKKSA